MPYHVLTTKVLNDLFDEVATQLRWFRVISNCSCFALQRSSASHVSSLRLALRGT
jgi:hypothetical protein